MGLPGVGSWRLALPVLEHLKARTTVIASTPTRAQSPGGPPSGQPSRRAPDGCYELILEVWAEEDGKGIDACSRSGTATPFRRLEGDASIVNCGDRAERRSQRRSSPSPANAPAKPAKQAASFA